MTKEEVYNYCKSLKGAIYRYHSDWKCGQFLIGDKFFILIGTDAGGKEIFSLKCDPVRSEELRAAFNDSIFPGYYLNKKHWISIFFDNELSGSLIKDLIECSYTLVFNSLTKKVQKEILG